MIVSFPALSAYPALSVFKAADMPDGRAGRASQVWPVYRSGFVLSLRPRAVRPLFSGFSANARTGVASIFGKPHAPARPFPDREI
jgi:hypothetical protein